MNDVYVLLYRRKPVVVEAVQLTRESFDAVGEWAGVKECWGLNAPKPGLLIDSPGGGVMKAFLGDWVIKNAHGEINVCNPVTFAAAYEPAR